MQDTIDVSTEETSIGRAGILELLGYAELEDRVRDLERDVVTYREIAAIGIHQAHKAHLREQQLIAEIDRLRVQVRELRELLNQSLGESVADCTWRPLPPFDASDPQVIA